MVGQSEAGDGDDESGQGETELQRLVEPAVPLDSQDQQLRDRKSSCTPMQAMKQQLLMPLMSSPMVDVQKSGTLSSTEPLGQWL